LTFASGSYSLDSTPLDKNTITRAALSGGAYDDFYITRNINEPLSTDINDAWDYDSVLRAKFEGDLHAGNAKFIVDNTDALRVKRRIKGRFDWITLFEVPVNSVEDFSFEKFDYAARSNTEYEYALAAALGGVESAYASDAIKTDFDGLFVMGNGEFYVARIEVKFNNQQQNKPAAAVATIGRKYPFVISNGEPNYRSGSVSAIFAELDDSGCKYDFEDSWKYRERLDNFLYNGDPKLLKYNDGRMRLISVSGDSVKESDWNGVDEVAVTSFDWTEIGDCDDGRDLYINGLTDYPQ
jgi:hypothetical protein